MGNKPNKRSNKTQWYRADMHLHTPASADYQEPEITYLDILRRAEMRGLDIIAFTDHNSVAGYGAMLAEIEELEMLARRERALPEEKRRLAEYRRLLDKILVLPGFEFTATFGFHILGIFSPEMRTRQIEHILLSLHVPAQSLDEGITNIGASSDVLTAYRAINEAGGIVIAAHANSTHGVAMRGFDFGGQTRIAYTQDPYLHCLEVTDLDRRGRGATSRFFDGTKPEYPRRMRCIQGSDAHRLAKDPRNEKNLGVGDRITEFLLPERSFEALRELIRGNDFARSRPYRGSDIEVYDYVQQAREAGPSIVQAFHESLARQGGRLYGIIADVCAFANTNGGTIYIGVSPDMTVPPAGVHNLGESTEMLRTEITHRITPPLETEIDAQETAGKAIIRIQVPRGDDPPYAIDDNKIYVREEAETSLAVRDEIVQLVAKNLRQTLPVVPAPVSVVPETAAVAPPESIVALPGEDTAPEATGETPVVSGPSRRGRRGRGGRGNQANPGMNGGAQSSSPANSPAPSGSAGQQGNVPAQTTPAMPTLPAATGAALSNAPRTGVEIIGTETRKGEQYHIMRDLRNGSIVKNVTRTSARRLWHYAIMEHETNPINLQQVQWVGDIGLWKRYKRGGVIRYDLVQSEHGSIRIFYGVTEDGMHGPWQQFITDEEPLIVEEGGEE